MFAVFKDQLSVDENLFHACGILMRLLESGVVLNRRRVKDQYVGKIALAQKAPIPQRQVGGGKPTGAVYCLFETE